MPDLSSEEIREAFLREAESRGVRVLRTFPDGRIIVEHDDIELTVSLENVERQVLRDGSLTAVRSLVDSILAVGDPLPAWAAAQSRLFLQAEPSDIEAEAEDVVRKAATDSVQRILVYLDEEESRISWIAPAQLQEWGVSTDAAWRIAEQNLAARLAKTPIQVEDIDGMKLGMFDTDSVLKASLVFSSNFKAVVQPKLGWPVYAVIPCRDFAYLFPAKELIPRMGSTVVEEYKASGYSITTEVFLISDNGVQAIGQFPVD